MQTLTLTLTLTLALTLALTLTLNDPCNSASARLAPPAASTARRFTYLYPFRYESLI